MNEDSNIKKHQSHAEHVAQVIEHLPSKHEALSFCIVNFIELLKYIFKWNINFSHINVQSPLNHSTHLVPKFDEGHECKYSPYS
jgi:hypothetical protein